MYSGCIELIKFVQNKLTGERASYLCARVWFAPPGRC